jgi:hypothetical protein
LSSQRLHADPDDLGVVLLPIQILFSSSAARLTGLVVAPKVCS